MTLLESDSLLLADIEPSTFFFGHTGDSLHQSIQVMKYGNQAFDTFLLVPASPASTYGCSESSEDDQLAVDVLRPLSSDLDDDDLVEWSLASDVCLAPLSPPTSPVASLGLSASDDQACMNLLSLDSAPASPAAEQPESPVSNAPVSSASSTGSPSTASIASTTATSSSKAPASKDSVHVAAAPLARSSKSLKAPKRKSSSSSSSSSSQRRSTVRSRSSLTSAIPADQLFVLENVFTPSSQSSSQSKPAVPATPVAAAAPVSAAIVPSHPAPFATSASHVEAAHHMSYFDHFMISPAPAAPAPAVFPQPHLAPYPYSIVHSHPISPSPYLWPAVPQPLVSVAPLVMVDHSGMPAPLSPPYEFYYDRPF
ncbi:uncharacterized protein BJ171DRAFT_585004 [Polychytrium aggregatum]|uniref:uncharacterized protein n=1 Tax=Polychytrium aggregatum TaxID=110093 RepID=UPI0022FE8E92|nr:uncharacterized protein BJ171DRAFT_585004 [Polychytrium aggregatum]KAI9199716.1 hypothetical protein BJ171DRAFT_585004 [Polychytrium aggregatum]